MHDILRNRILRKLEALPPAQLYQVLDFVEFMESRHAPTAARASSGFQRFAERLEDNMRARSIAARTMNGTMRLVSTAGKVIGGLAGAFESAARAASESARASQPRLDLSAREESRPVALTSAVVDA